MVTNVCLDSSQQKLKWITTKVILLVSIGLIFTIEIIHSEYVNERRSSTECLNYIQYMNKSANIARYHLWHYKVDLTIDTRLEKYYGDVFIDICVLLPNTSKLIFTLNPRSRISLVEVWNTLTHIYLNFSDYDFEGDNMIMTFNNSLSPDFYTLKIKFALNFTDNFFQSQFRDPDNKTLMTLQSNLKLIPYWDIISKVTFHLVLTHNDGYTALSNGLKLNTTRLSPNKNNEKSKFANIAIKCEDELMFVLLPTKYKTYSSKDLLTYKSYYGTEQDPSIIIKTWYKTNTTATLSFAETVIYQLTVYLLYFTNETYRNTKIDHVIIPDVPHNISENLYRGIIIYRESDVTYDEKTNFIDVKFNVIQRIVSKVAYQWIDDLITPKISDLWMSQSFAAFLQLYVFNEQLGPYYKQLGKVYEMYLLQHFSCSSFNQDIDSTNEQFQLPSLLSENLSEKLFKTSSMNTYTNIYIKGALLLRMLERIIGWKTFRNGVIKLINENKYTFELVTSDDLWSTMQIALKHQAEPKPKVDIKKVMDTYLRQKSYPVVVVTRDYKTGITTFSQQPYNTFYMLRDVIDNMRNIESELNPSKWWIPVTWTTQTDPNFSKTTIIWLRPKKIIKIITNPNDWIILNLQQMGYYRVHYDQTNWGKIGYFLKNKNYTKIHVLNRARLIYDVCDMFKNGRIYLAFFMYFTSYLSRETEYTVWIPMLNCLRSDDLTIYFNFPENKELQVYLARYFDGILSNISYEENFDDNDITKLARAELANVACRFDNPTCINAARNKLEKYLTDPKTHQISLNLEYWMFCYGLKTANITIWHQVLQLLSTQKKSLCPLACTKDSNIIMNFLRDIVEIDMFVEKKDVSALIDCIASHWIDDDRVFSYLLKKFVARKHLYSVESFISALHTEDQLNRMYNLAASIYQMTDIYSDDEYFKYNRQIEKYKQKFLKIRNKFQNVQHTKIF